MLLTNVNFFPISGCCVVSCHRPHCQMQSHTENLPRYRINCSQKGSRIKWMPIRLHLDCLLCSGVSGCWVSYNNLPEVSNFNDLGCTVIHSLSSVQPEVSKFHAPSWKPWVQRMKKELISISVVVTKPLLVVFHRVATDSFCRNINTKPH